MAWCNLRFFPKHASGMRVSDINMLENWVHALALAAGPRRLSETTLSLILTISVKTCRLIETRRKIVRLVETRRHNFLARPKLPRKMWPRNMLGKILNKIRQKYVNVCQFDMPFVQGA